MTNISFNPTRTVSQLNFQGTKDQETDTKAQEAARLFKDADLHTKSVCLVSVTTKMAVKSFLLGVIGTEALARLTYTVDKASNFLGLNRFPSIANRLVDDKLPSLKKLNTFVPKKILLGIGAALAAFSGFCVYTGLSMAIRKSEQQK